MYSSIGEGGLYASFPCVIAECFSERVAAYMLIQTGVMSGLFHDAECLRAGEGRQILTAVRKR